MAGHCRGPDVKPFRTLAVIRQDRAAVWTLVRDQLDELVPLISDVESVTVDSRREDPDGTVHLVNLWRAKADVPALLRAVVKPDMLAWTDTAEWKPGDWACHWRIRPQVFADRVDCVGVTRYEEAMGGRGTRIVLEGELDVANGKLPGVSSLIGGPTARGIESFVTGLVPRNFQKLAKAIAAHAAP
jgi:hypothetical protein